MKATLGLLFALLTISLTAVSCLKDDCSRMQEVQYYEEIVVPADSFRIEIQTVQGRELENPGKIYVLGNILLINEINEGIHIVDNTNPQNPIMSAFIEIPGNVDMAYHHNHLYADSYSDLLTIDVNNWLSPQLVKREKDVFSLEGWNEEGLVVGYEIKSEWVEVDCSQGGGDFNRFDGTFPTSGGSSESFNSLGGGPIQGIAGSMARFGIAANHLYAIDHRFLHVFDLQQAASPVNSNKIEMDFGIETLFPYGDHLFIGAEMGMYIYDNSNPKSPSYLSEFQHARACDPVFVKEDRAYVTLRNGNSCANSPNQLDVLDISSITNPKLVKSYSMTNPHGLSVVNETLFLCDGTDGLKLFDIVDDFSIDENLLSHLRDGKTFDVIALSEEHIIVTGENGIWQYNTQDRKNVELLSFINSN